MEPVCARCPKVFGRSCCEVREGEALATLTGADVERIAAETRLAARRFVTAEWLSEEEARDYERHRPLFDGYFRHLPRRWTLKVSNGACVFHGATGCTLSADARPVACRLYPFEPVAGALRLLPERHGVAEPTSHACLAVEEADDEEALLARFGTSAEALHALAETLAREVSEHARQTAPGGRLRDLATS